MEQLTLVIGNKNYSSWSLRAWLYLKINDINFDEIRLPLDTNEFQNEIGQYSPTKCVPVLIDGDTRVWDSLAIIEYVNRHFPVSISWPHNKHQEAMALSAVAEMHSGFTQLRKHYPMNCRMKPFKAPLIPGVEKDLSRLDHLWSECLAQSNGPGLFGEISIADIYFAPVVYRCHTYQLPLSAKCQSYVSLILQIPALQAWSEAAAEEAETVAADEWDVIHADRPN